METKDIFEGMAARYETPERVHMAGLIADAIRLRIAPGKAASAMDYGCGAGLVGLALLGCFESMLFVDFSPQMIQLIQEKLARAGIHSAEALCSDFLTEAPPPREVDYIILSLVLLHVKDIPLLLSRLHGLLRPGGRLLAVDFDYNTQIESDKVHPGFVQAELQELALQAGFSAAGSQTFYHGEKIFMGQDASMFLMEAQV